MARIALKRGWIQIKETPSFDDVVELMKTVESGLDENDPPDFAIGYSNTEQGSLSCDSELLFMLAFSTDQPPSWMIQFSSDQSTSVIYLASEPPSTRFELRTCCGLVQKYRSACLLERSPNVDEAIVWFLKYGAACPSLRWIDYAGAVRDVEAEG